MITISERREHESAKSFVLRVLIDNIINTRLEPGEKLNEPELCEQLGVSRTPLRAVLETELAGMPDLFHQPGVDEGDIGADFRPDLDQPPLRQLQLCFPEGGAAH